ncbi:MAG: CoA-binding protein [bacterium]
MDVLWNPRRVAMIGATNNLGKWGGIILARILGDEFNGELLPVNPKNEYVLGQKAVKSLEELTGPIDLAIIVTPASTVPDILRQAARKSIPAAIVITSGFSESGDEGVRLEEEIAGICRQAGMLMVGPNTMGVFSSSPSMNCLMAPVSPLRGSAACIAQSGNVGTHMLFRGKLRGLGYEKFVSSGNEGDTSFEEYLWYFGQDPRVNAVLGYMEGLDPDSDFMDIAPAVTREKPVIVYKGGRTGAGAHAASSHTGALAGEMEVFAGAMRQAGVIMAESNKQVVELARALELQPVPKGSRIGILTRGGGWGVITADACAEAGLTITRLSDETLQKLDKILPPYWSRGNPVDMVAVLSNQAYIDCLEIVEKDPNVDAVIALGANVTAQGSSTLDTLRQMNLMSDEEIKEKEARLYAEAEEFVNSLREYLDQSEKTVLTVGRWRERPDWESGLMMIQEPEEAARMMARMVEYGNYLARTEGKDRG